MDASKEADALGGEAAKGGLLIDMRRGQTLFANGCEMVFLGKASVIITTRARVVFGGHAMRPDQITTPLRSLYYAIQSAYAGDEFGQPAAVERLVRRVREEGECDGALALADLIEQDRWVHALQMVRRRIYAEERGTGF